MTAKKRTDSDFPPREYALLADGERGILVGPRGDFVWMCAPRWNFDALFCSPAARVRAHARPVRTLKENL